MKDQYRVVGTRRVGGVDPGGVVILDHDRVIIPALISAGHIETIEPDSVQVPPIGTPAGPKRKRLPVKDGVPMEVSDDHIRSN